MGYQLTLATDIDDCRKNYFHRQGSITSVQAIYVPADDLIGLTPTTSFTPRCYSIIGQIAEIRIYPAVDPLTQPKNFRPKSSW